MLFILTQIKKALQKVCIITLQSKSKPQNVMWLFIIFIFAIMND